MAAPDSIAFDGPDGTIGALRWEGVAEAPTVVAIHGITANARHWDPLATCLSGAAHVVAVDLRGRGRSVDHPGPYGMRAHAADVAAVIREIGGPLVLIGHSMGTYVALMTAKLFPDLVRDLVLVDGGTSLTIAAHADPDAALDAALGPAIQRLQKVWADREEYAAMWAAHPAYAEGISDELRHTLLADLAPATDSDGFRVTVDEAAIRHDGRELFVDPEVGRLLEERSTPTTVIHAPLGLDGAPPPLVRDEAIAALPQHRWIPAPGHNHYTVLLSPQGAELVAGALRSTAGISDPADRA